jgi:tripartite-type tricarboxylate transporter receptor subunit TctC
MIARHAVDAWRVGPMTSRRAITLAVLAVVSCLSVAASAQNYPSRPITMIVPFPAGGGYDIIGRVVAERMKQSLGQPFTIQNVTGAEGTIAVGRAARAAPDGYTLVLGGTSTHVLNGALYSLPYDLLNDFAPISPLGTYPLILFARKTMPAADVKELVAWLKVNPKQASAGIGTASIHVLTVLFQKEIGTQITLVCLIEAIPRYDRISLPVGLTCSSITRISFQWCGPGASRPTR